MPEDAPKPAPTDPPEHAEAPGQNKPPVAPVKPPRRGPSPVWIIPIIAALLGAWLAFRHFSEEGPTITVQFENAEGITAGKTPVLCRNVNVGTVSDVELTPDTKAVVVTLSMTQQASSLLRTDTQIWVVKPRYGGSGISGLDTLVSGSYMELQPGVKKEKANHYIGLENPPVTPPGVPGLHVKLIAEAAGGVNPGSSIIYKGITVGKIETRTFYPESGQVIFGAFVNGDYSKLINEGTKFWNASGIDLQVGADGFKLRTGTLESLIAGGVTFSEPEKDEKHPAAVPDGASYTLYDSFSEANEIKINPTLPYLLLFTGSVRGLAPDAPVEFRGIRIGTVMGISFHYLPDDAEHRVPVLIKLDPTLLINLPSNDFTETRAYIAKAVENGLRVSLKTGNLLTGQLYVDLDFNKDAPPATVTELRGYHVLPTTASGLGQLEEKLSAILDKVKALPLEATVANANDLLAQFKGVAQHLDEILQSKDTQALPTDLRGDLSELQKTLQGYNNKSDFYQGINGTLRQLDDTLKSLRGLTDTLERKPNSLLFGSPGPVAPPRGSR